MQVFCRSIFHLLTLTIGAPDSAVGSLVHAFEPSAENFQFLQDNIARNGCQGQIRAYPIGIGSADTVEELSCYGTGSSFVRGWDEGQGDDAGIESVNVKPLDVVFNPRQLPYPTVVKIDVEGYELPVLHGGERILQHANVACILCEIGHRHHPGGKNPDALMVIDTLRAYGYECYGMKNSVPSIEGPRSNELGTASEFSACEPDDWPTQWICLRPDTDIHEGIFDVLPLFGLFLDLYPIPVEDLRQATSDLV